MNVIQTSSNHFLPGKYPCTHPPLSCNWVGPLSKNFALIHDLPFFPKHCSPIDGSFIVEIYPYTHPSPPCNWVGIRIQNWFQNQHSTLHPRTIFTTKYLCTHPSPPCNWVGLLSKHLFLIHDSDRHFGTQKSCASNPRSLHAIQQYQQ